MFTSSRSDRFPIAKCRRSFLLREASNDKTGRRTQAQSTDQPRLSPRTILLLAMGRAECSEVAFIGLADEGAPAIEHQFNRILKEQIAMIPGVHLVDNAEVRRLQSQIGLLSYPAISTSLAASLRRCVRIPRWSSGGGSKVALSVQ